MSAKVFGLTTNQALPQVDFSATLSGDGTVSARRSFLARKQDKDNLAFRQKFLKGTPITNLCPDLAFSWSYLRVENVEFADERGGFCRVNVDFEGVNTDETESDREVNYSLRGVLVERDIILHPKFIAEVADITADTGPEEHQAIVAFFRGTAEVANPAATTGWEIRDTATQEVMNPESWTNANALKWFTKIYKDGRRTYTAATYEWTRSTANAGGLSGADLANFGKEDTPQGNPPEPTDVTGWWRLVDVGEDKTANSSANSLTWRFEFGEPDPDIDQ